MREVGERVGRTAAQVLADLQTIRRFYPGKRFYQSTILPRSTGDYTSLNQTPHSSNGARVTLNDAIRALPLGFHGYFESADQVESARNSGIWQPNMTGDGLHPINTGYAAIQNSRVYDPTVLARI